MTDSPYLLPLPPNRVRRNYEGGLGIDLFEGRTSGTDGDQPEDWVASTVEARNPGLPPVTHEGLATVRAGDRELLLRDLCEEAPDHFLGATHTREFGSQLGFLTKILDSSMRLHVQAHPTAEFAQQHLDSRWGKLETYVILGVRPEVDPTIRLGFQHAPSKAEWRRIVEEQDIDAMDACFEPIPVAVGEVWYVPGGLPHAIGEGLTVLEVMEPTDLVVRCEFERQGIVVPPPARFMGRGLDFCLDIFDYTELSPQQIRGRYHVEPEPLIDQDGCRLERLIGSRQTNCFEIRRLQVTQPTGLPTDGRFALLITNAGSGTIATGDSSLDVSRGSRCFQAAAAPALQISPAEASLELLICLPGHATGA